MDARRTGRLQMVLDDHGARASAAARLRLRSDGAGNDDCVQVSLGTKILIEHGPPE